MRYLSIYKSAERGGPPTAEHIAAMGRLIEELSASGELLATEGCLPTALGVRVRRDRDAYTVTDGPFTESKEVVGGFALLQAPTKEAIVALTKRFLEAAGEGDAKFGSCMRRRRRRSGHTGDRLPMDRHDSPLRVSPQPKSARR